VRRRPDHKHRRWEYRVVRFPHEDAGGHDNLNGAGYDGWEAVGVVPRDLGESWVLPETGAGRGPNRGLRESRWRAICRARTGC
jgi:hypothetical protein